MITINTRSDENGVAQYSTGQLTTDAGAAVALVIPAGFAARRVRLIQTSGTGFPITYEWIEGMASGNALMSIATGVQTIDATKGPIVTDRNVTLPALALIASATFVWEIQG